MEQIIKLDKRHLSELTTIDYESEHQGDKENKVTKKEMETFLRRRFAEKQELFFGLKKDGILEGYVTLKPFFPGYKHCEVYWLAVRKKSQGQRIGTRLMRFIESYAKKQGFRKLFLYTGKGMKKTRRFYEKLQYVKINEFHGYYGYRSGNTTAVLYGKKL